MSKRKHKRNTPAAAKADTNYGTFWGAGTSGSWMGGGVVGRNTNLSRTEWGAATAYQIMPEVNRAMNLRADALGSLPWHVLTLDANGKEQIMATSEDAIPRHPLAKAFADTYHYANRSLISLMCYSHDLSGEVFIQKTFTPETGRGLFWLNPLGTEPIISGGAITNFQYSSITGGVSEMLQPKEVAYYHTWNPYNDHRGQGLTQVVMQKINMARNLDDFIEDFFGNNARPSVIVSPTGDEPFTTDQKTKLQQQMDVFLKGRGNQWSTYVSPTNAKYDPLDQPKIGDHYTIAPELSQYIYTVYGVPKALAGDDSGTQYKTGDDVKVAFFQITIIPLATHIERYINSTIMPYLDDSGAFFRFDTSEFDLVSDDDKLRMDIATSAYRDGLWTRNKGLEYTKTDKLGDIDFLQIEGIPVPLHEVGQYWKYKLVVRPAPEEAAPVGQQLGVDTKEPPVPLQAPIVKPMLGTGDKPIEEPQVIEGKAHQATAEDELEAWRKVAGKSHTKALKFEAINLRGDLGDWIAESLTASAGEAEAVKAVFVEARERLATKAIQATQLDFEGRFESILIQARDGSIDRRSFGATVRYLLNSFGQKAYADGLTDGGVDAAELDEADRGTIATMLADQSQYVTELGAILFKGDGITDFEAADKPTLWFNKAISPMYQAGLLSADSNSIYEWVYGDTDHCDSCLKLNGQRHRLRSYKARGLMPHSSELDCGGWLCKCKLVRSRGKARGSWV